MTFVEVRARGALATTGGRPALPMTGYAEAVVGVLEFWRDAGTRGTTRDFDVMAPGASAGRFALRLHGALVGALRVPLGRNGVVVRVVPVAAPFVEVVADVVKAECVRSVAGDRFGSS